MFEQSETAHQLLVNSNEMSKADIQYWLVKFVAEIKRKDGNYYPLDTVYQICCGLGRALHYAGRTDIDILIQLNSPNSKNRLMLT